MLFTDDELASYPGAEGIPIETAILLQDLAEARIFAVVPESIATDSLVAKGIALEVVARAYRNPGGFTSETIDDYTYRRDGATRSSGVYLTATEITDLLALNPGAPRSRVRSVRFRSWSAPYQ